MLTPTGGRLAPAERGRGRADHAARLRSAIVLLCVVFLSAIAFGRTARGDSPTAPAIRADGKSTDSFVAPPRLSVTLEGLAGDSGTSVRVHREGTTERREIVIDRWRTPVTRTVRLPEEWVGERVRVVVETAEVANSSVRLTNVEPTGPVQLAVRQSPALGLPLLVLLVLVALLAPGMGLLTFLPPAATPDGFAPALAMVGSCALGYAVFWLFLFDSRVGTFASAAILVASLAILTARRERVVAMLRANGGLTALFLMLVAATFYVAVLYVADSGETPDTVATTRFFLARPLDNLIPEHFADRLHQGGDPRTTGAEWTSSDRPPLQTGIVLMVRPLTDAAGIAPDLAYQVLGTTLQCAWIPSFWALFTVLSIRPVVRSMVLAFTIFSGFFLYNSVYVWPKLLAGSLVLIAAALVVQSTRDGVLRRSTLALASVCASLALLAHSGSAFSLLGLAGVLAATGVVSIGRNLPGIVLGVIIGIGLLLPWRAYQKTYDPPGDRLLKIHLAGVNDPDDQRSAAAAIAESWGALSPGEIAVRRVLNLKTLTGVDGVMASAVEAEDRRLVTQALTDPLLMWRTREQQHVGTSLGLLNLGWIAVALVFVRHSRRSASDRTLLLLLLSALAGLAAAACLLFSPGSTVTTHVSYADVMLLHFCLATALAGACPKLAAIVLAGHLAHFSAIWLLTTPPTPAFALPSSTNLPSLLVACVAAAGLSAILIAQTRQACEEYRPPAP